MDPRMTLQPVEVSPEVVRTIPGVMEFDASRESLDCDDGEHRVWLATFRDGVPVGCISVYCRFALTGLFVAEGWRGQGIASELARQGTARLEWLGVNFRDWWLCTGTPRVFERCGWYLTDEMFRDRQVMRHHRPELSTIPRQSPPR